MTSDNLLLHQDKESIHKCLEKAVTSTLAEMAFIDAQEVEKKEIEYKQITTIDIASPFRGKIIVRLPLIVKKDIVEYIHGEEWDSLLPDQIDDCLLELLNVLGGSFLFNLYGEETKYKVLFPEMVFDETELDDLTSLVDLYFDAEGECFSVSFIVENN